MPEPLAKAFKVVGVTPWQLFFGFACIGSWWGTVQPLPGQLAQLNTTVQQISLKVEVHSVLLQAVTRMEGEVSQMRRELSTIEGKLASNPHYPKTP